MVVVGERKGGNEEDSEEQLGQASLKSDGFLRSTSQKKGGEKTRDMFLSSWWHLIRNKES